MCQKYIEVTLKSRIAFITAAVPLCFLILFNFIVFFPLPPTVIKQLETITAGRSVKPAVEQKVVASESG